MFARIAPRYDLLNHGLSLGIDRRWRARAVARAAQLAGGLRGQLAVDVCCGTGDLTLELARLGARTIGVDFTPQMLLHTKDKLGRGAAQGRAALPPAVFVQGDALCLPIASRSAALLTCAFGVRNLSDPKLGLAEFARVLRPGGVLMVLEFSSPRGRALGLAYNAYMRRVLPWIGAKVSGDREAYRYLQRTVAAWPAPPVFQAQIEASGFARAGYALLWGGIACLHWGFAVHNP